MFTGLSAFPITPFKNEEVDYSAFERVINNLTNAKVDSICAMGSTGLYPYLTQNEIFQVAKATVDLAGTTPVMAGIGALRTKNVLKNAEAAQKAGVSAVLLAPMSYHILSDDEVYSLYETVTAELSVPLCIYENPRATNFTFSDELYRRLAQLPKVAAVKIPGMPFVTDQGATRLNTLRELLPKDVAIGVSGDKFGGAGIAQGCDLWLSVLGGLFPNTVKQIIGYAKQGNNAELVALDNALIEMWSLFERNNGGVRVMATAAHILGYAEANCLPAPLKTLSGEDRAILVQLLNRLQLT